MVMGRWVGGWVGDKSHLLPVSNPDLEKVTQVHTQKNFKWTLAQWNDESIPITFHYIASFPALSKEPTLWRWY